MRFSRQKYWSRVPFPISEDPPDPGIEATFLSSPALSGRFLTTGPPGKHQCRWGSSNQSVQNKTGARENSANRQPLDLSCNISSSWVCSLQILDLPTSIIMWAIPENFFVYTHSNWLFLWRTWLIHMTFSYSWGLSHPQHSRLNLSRMLVYTYPSSFTPGQINSEIDSTRSPRVSQQD